MLRRKVKFFVFSLMILCIYNFFGIGDYLYARSFDEEFSYPLNVDLRPIIKERLSGRKANISPINFYPYRFLTNSGKCNTVEKLDLFIVVKSAMKNRGHRMAIRQTYGQENLIPGRIIKTLFFLGTDERHNFKSQTQKGIEKEMEEFKDIIQIDFHDSYYNNTIKTMMSFRWLYEHCSNADFYLFTDDDMYISVTNLLDYVHDQVTPEESTLDRDNNIKQSTRYYGSDRETHMYAGYVFKSAPLRYKTSKWRVSLEEYPWDKWPLYVTAGAYVLSNISMKTMYIGSFYVKHFRFDDIYLGIIAKKVGIVPIHCPRFYFYKKNYDKEDYKDVIASHGYGDSEELVRVWKEQNSGGHFI